MYLRGIVLHNHQKSAGSLQGRAAYDDPSSMSSDERGGREWMPLLSRPAERSNLQGSKVVHQRRSEWWKRDGNRLFGPEDVSSSVIGVKVNRDLTYRFILFHALRPRHDDGQGSLGTVRYGDGFL